MNIPKKYIMANIKIPIEIKENNKCETYMDLLNMELTPLEILPEKITDNALQEQLKQNLYIFLSKMFPHHEDLEELIDNHSESQTEHTSNNNISDNKPDIIQLYVDKEQLKRLKKPLTTTFKTYNKKSCKKYTIKNYDSNGR